LAKFLSAGKVSSEQLLVFKSIPLETLIDEIYGISGSMARKAACPLEG